MKFFKIALTALALASVTLFSGCSDDDNTSGGIDLSSVVWLDKDISGWPETAAMSASVAGDGMHMPYDKATVWPGTNAAGARVNANAWVFVNLEGTWYAATWEYLRVGQTSKSAATVTASHINHPPLNSWRPHSGEEIGIMVSGLVRGGSSNISERSNVSMLIWP